MKTKIPTLILFSLLSMSVRFAENATTPKKPASQSGVSIFQVHLECPAAPQIGCGSHAKPMLLELERDPNITEAWLNRAGTRIAVVWQPDSKPKARRKVVAKLKEQDATEVKGKLRGEALAEFLSGEAWYRGADVDRLSEEEAGIMAGRLIRKIRSLVTLTDQKSKAMEEQFTLVLARRLTGQLPDRSAVEKEVLRVSRDYLNENDVVRLQEALKDFHPNRDEP